MLVSWQLLLFSFSLRLLNSYDQSISCLPVFFYFISVAAPDLSSLIPTRTLGNSTAKEVNSDIKLAILRLTEVN